jgi:hypothetical protein
MVFSGLYRVLCLTFAKNYTNMTNFKLFVQPYMAGAVKRIAVNIHPFNNTNKAFFLPKIKLVLGREWCSIRKVWHFPYDTAAYSQLKALFPATLIEAIPESIHAPTDYERLEHARLNPPKERSVVATNTVFRLPAAERFDPQTLPFYIDFEGKRIHIKSGKGKKDRIVMLGMGKR